MKRKDLPMTIVEERLMVFRTEEPAWQPGFTPATISLDLDIVAGPFVDWGGKYRYSADGDKLTRTNGGPWRRLREEEEW